MQHKLTPSPSMISREDATSLGEARRGVLVADDAPSSRNLLAQLLLEEGYDVTVARDGVDLQLQVRHASLARWPRDGFDAILAGVEMPLCDGFEALESLRAKLIFTPVILIAARCDAALRRRALSLGATEVFSRPFDVAALRSVVRAACARADGF
ncbi:MAG: response regulator [Polyangiales bacterium]